MSKTDDLIAQAAYGQIVYRVRTQRHQADLKNALRTAFRLAREGDYPEVATAILAAAELLSRHQETHHDG